MRASKPDRTSPGAGGGAGGVYLCPPLPSFPLLCTTTPWELGAFRGWGLLPRATPLSKRRLSSSLYCMVRYSLGWYLQPPPFLPPTHPRARCSTW